MPKDVVFIQWSSLDRRSMGGEWYMPTRFEFPSLASTAILFRLFSQLL